MREDERGAGNVTDSNPSIEEYWHAFRTRPHMYVGKYDLEAVRAFSIGYNHALSVRGVPSNPRDPFEILESPEFNDFVSVQLGGPPSCVMSWVEHIGSRVDDPQAGVEMLFRLLDEYRNRVNPPHP